MENKKKKERVVLLLLVVAVLLMAIGFAAYTRQLTINGTVTVKGGPWNVHYVANSITEGENSEHATAATISQDTTDFSFTVTLEKPGDFYEATVNVVNEGSMNALLKSVDMNLSAKDSNNATVDSADLAKYFSYTITYNNGTTYSQTTNNISGTTLAGGQTPSATHPVKIKVMYVQPATADDLPTSDITVTVTGSLNYESET